MEHQAQYEELIAFAKRRGTPNSYYERHHVEPKSIGGSDDVSNIVHLTVQEHLQCKN